VIPTLHHRSFNQHDDVGMFIFVSEFVLEYLIAHPAILASGAVGAIGIVDVILHRLRVLTLKAGGSRNGINDVAAFLVHDDAARPNREFGVAHDHLVIIDTYSLSMRRCINRRCSCQGESLIANASDCHDRIPEPPGNRRAKRRTERREWRPEIPQSRQAWLSCTSSRYRPR